MKGITMDKYTKSILTILTIGIIILNIQIFKDGLISEAKAGDYGADPSRNIVFELGVKRVVKKFCTTTSEEGIYGAGSFKIRCF